MIELDGENYLDGQEASSMLGVKVSTLYAYVSRGVLRSYKQGIKRQRLYKQAELEALLQLRPSDVDLAVQPHPTTSRPANQLFDSPAPGKKRAEIPHARDWVSEI